MLRQAGTETLTQATGTESADVMPVHLLLTNMNSLLPSGGGLQYWSSVASGPGLILLHF